MDDPCLIRPVDDRELAGLLELERACFSDPWSEQSMREVLGMTGTIALGMECAGRLVGYGIARVVGGTSEVLTFGIMPDRQGGGLGGRLLDALVDRVRESGAGEIWLEVRQGNAAARALYQSRGFQVAGMRRAYYRRPTEDALVYRMSFFGHA